MASIAHTWHVRELQVSLGIPTDEIRRRLFTMRIREITADRYPLKAKVYLKAQAEGKALCERCFQTGEPGPCTLCKKGYLKRLPEPEPAT